MVLHTDESEIDFADGFRAIQKAGAIVAQRRHVGVWRSLVTWCLVIGLAVMLLILFQEPGPRRRAGAPSASPFSAAFWPPFGAFLGVGMGSLFTAVMVGRWAVPRTVPKRDSGPLSFRIDGEGIMAESHRGRTLYRWSFFGRLAETEKSFVLLGKGLNSAPGVLLVIPKSALAGQEEMTGLRSMLRTNVLPEATLQRQGSGAFPIGSEEPTELAAGPSAMAEGKVILDNVFFERGDFAVATAGWRRRLHWGPWGFAVLGILGAGMAVCTVIALYMALYVGPASWILVLAPCLLMFFVIRQVTWSLTNLAGLKSAWRSHVLSHGPASVILRDEGIVLRSALHEMLMKVSGILLIVESPAAFSVVGKQWEIVVPKRFLTAERIEEAREELRKFGEIKSVERGRTLLVAAAA